MKPLYYIKYFFHIAWNWNLRLAFFSIYHEIRGERKYGIDTARLNNLHVLTVKGNNRQHAEIYQGSSYYLLEKIFVRLQQLQAPDAFIDIGCGKGRVMVVASHFGFKNILGVEFAKELCDEARENCKQITEIHPLASWEVIHANAADFRFRLNIHVFFFFNPFKEVVMKQVVKNILRSLRDNPRKVFIVYVNPQYKEVFIKEGFKEIYFLKRMAFVEASIFEKEL